MEMSYREVMVVLIHIEILFTNFLYLMITYNKKRTMYVLLASGIIIALFFFVAIPLAYEWHYRKIYPYDNLRIYQNDTFIEVSAFSAFTNKIPIIQDINHKDKKIIFWLMEWWLEESSGIQTKLPLDWLVGYEMCYQNKYWEYCFWKTK